MLPESVLYEAAIRHVIKLGQQERVEEAERLYFKLFNLDSSFFALCEAARSLISLHLSRNNFNKAIMLYENFPACDSDGAKLEEKIKTAHLLVHAALPQRMQKAYELWADFGRYDLNSALKWHWAETGIALLKCCYQLGHADMALKIHGQMHEHGACERSRRLIAKADRIIAKIGL